MLTFRHMLQTCLDGNQASETARVAPPLLAPPPAGPARSPRTRPPGIAASHSRPGCVFPRHTCVHQLRTARPRGASGWTRTAPQGGSRGHLSPGTPVLRSRPPAQGTSWKARLHPRGRRGGTRRGGRLRTTPPLALPNRLCRSVPPQSTRDHAWPPSSPPSHGGNPCSFTYICTILGEPTPLHTSVGHSSLLF